MAKNNDKSLWKSWFGVGSARSSIFLMASIFFAFISVCDEAGMFNDKSNLYEDSKLVASSEEVDRIVENLEDVLDVEICEEEVDEYCLLNAILLNKNLSDSDKEFFYKYIDLFLDNPYLNKEDVYYSLLNLDISYMERPMNVSENVAGDFDNRKKFIRIFYDNVRRTTLAHEGVHCLYYNDKTSSLPTYFVEGMTELLANEYFDNNPLVEVNSYCFEVACCKLLCELTSPDIVLKSFTLGDMSFIISDMANTLNISYSDVEIAFNSLNTLFKSFNNELDYSIDKSSVFNYYMGVFLECANKKYSCDASEFNNVISNYMILNCMISDDPAKSFSSVVLESSYTPKAYFSSRLKKNVNDSVTYTKDK